jgi:glycosyltransferase involved in cell wall biosynthesis
MDALKPYVDPRARVVKQPRPPASPFPKIPRMVLIGNYLPRRCGIATFTTDVHKAVQSRYPTTKVDVWAMNDGMSDYAYPSAVTGTIEQNNLMSYRHAASEISASGAQRAWVQHEFGIFGGEAGSYILTLLDRLTIPVAVTLHTVLADPLPAQRRVMMGLIQRCDTLIVMAEAARTILRDVYACDPQKITVIPHGIPDRPFMPTGPMKRKLGWGDRKVILTFGLLSPGKGIETMIEAMANVVRHHPDALYVVLGATHPHTLAAHGEAYREGLKAMGDALGVADNLCWIDGFCETETLLDYLSAADIYVTPYLNPAQVTSGTLAYAVGLGKPIVSTPYIHARELLGDGLGRLVDFGDSAGFAHAIIDLLDDELGQAQVRKRAYALGRHMVWPRLAEAAMARFEDKIQEPSPMLVAIRPPAIPKTVPFQSVLDHSDTTGILQHSHYAVPDRRHGYCIDDNARALMLVCLDASIDAAQRARWANIFGAFVGHAWNPDTQRFRNFMSFERHWLEDLGSEDSNGRALWALGVAAISGPSEGQRNWAQDLFDKALPSLADMRSPRALAFSMLGCLSHALAIPDDNKLTAQMVDWGESLLSLYKATHQKNWHWFEPVLAYDNGRLPEAVIRAGTHLHREDLVACGLEALEWLTVLQTNDAGHFSAIGSDSFNRPFAAPLTHDQQPVEAASMIDACDAAFAATGDKVWCDRAINSYQWFLGKNINRLPVGNWETGACFDALTPTGVNLNQGAESLLAFHLATLTIQPYASR